MVSTRIVRPRPQLLVQSVSDCFEKQNGCSKRLDRREKNCTSWFHQTTQIHRPRRILPANCVWTFPRKASRSFETYDLSHGLSATTHYSIYSCVSRHGAELDVCYSVNVSQELVQLVTQDPNFAKCVILHDYRSSIVTQLFVKTRHLWLAQLNVITDWYLGCGML